MGLAGWNRHHGHGESKDPNEPDGEADSFDNTWAKPNIIIGSHQDAAEYRQNMARLEDLGSQERSQDDPYEATVKAKLRDEKFIGGKARPFSRFGRLTLHDLQKMDGDVK
jgi:hypothetical protein